MKVGDIVRLKGLDNSMKMVVVSKARLGVGDTIQWTVVFHDKDGRPQSYVYPEKVLEKVK